MKLYTVMKAVGAFYCSDSFLSDDSAATKTSHKMPNSRIREAAIAVYEER